MTTVPHCVGPTLQIPMQRMMSNGSNCRGCTMNLTQYNGHPVVSPGMKEENQYIREKVPGPLYYVSIVSSAVFNVVVLVCRIRMPSPQSSTLYIYYIYTELACTQSPFFQNLSYECTASVPVLGRLRDLQYILSVTY